MVETVTMRVHRTVSVPKSGDCGGCVFVKHELTFGGEGEVIYGLCQLYGGFLRQRAPNGSPRKSRDCRRDYDAAIAKQADELSRPKPNSGPPPRENLDGVL